jgi:hypothetical protein
MDGLDKLEWGSQKKKLGSIFNDYMIYEFRVTSNYGMICIYVWWSRWFGISFQIEIQVLGGISTLDLGGISLWGNDCRAGYQVLGQPNRIHL